MDAHPRHFVLMEQQLHLPLGHKSLRCCSQSVLPWLKAQDERPFPSVATGALAEVSCLINAPAVLVSIGVADLKPGLAFKYTHPVFAKPPQARDAAQTSIPLEPTTYKGKGSFHS